MSKDSRCRVSGTFMDAAFSGTGENMIDEQVPEEEFETLFEGEDEAVDAEVETETVETKDAEVEPDTKGAETQQTETPAVEEQKSIPKQAYHEEKRKRQYYQKESERLQSLIPKTDEAPDYNEDPEAYDRFQRDKWNQEQTQAQESAWNDRLEKSREASLIEHEDHVQVENVFSAFARQDPTLLQSFFDAPDPAKFAYDKGKEILAGLTKGEIPEKEPEKPEEKPAALTTPSLATATAQASNSVHVEKDIDLDGIFDESPMKY